MKWHFTNQDENAGNFYKKEAPSTEEASFL
jgi:hypothetical protein